MNDKLKELIQELNIKSNFLTTELKETGIDFSKYIENQKSDFQSLIKLAEYSNIINEKYILTPCFLNELVLIMMKHNKINSKLYNLNIDTINMEIFTGLQFDLLNILFDKNTNEYISVFLYDWDCCKNESQEITWTEKEQKHSINIKDAETLCQFLSPNKNYYNKSYYRDINWLEQNIIEARNIQKNNFNRMLKEDNFANKIAYDSFNKHISNLEEQYFKLTNENIEEINKITVKIIYDDDKIEEFSISGTPFDELKKYYLNRIFIFNENNGYIVREYKRKCISIELV